MRTAALPLANRIVRLVTQTGAIALLTTGFTMSTATTSQAFFNAEQTQHYIECAGWLLSDPETHAANCLPSRVGVPFRSLSEPVTGYIAPPKVVTTPDSPECKPTHSAKRMGGGGDGCDGGHEYPHKPWGDKPWGDKPWGDKPWGDKPWGHKPGNNQPS